MAITTKIISQNSLEWLQEKRIFFSPVQKNHLDMIGRSISFNQNAAIEPYVGFFGGVDKLCNLGSFTYSSSIFTDPNFTIGRYCSIAGGLKLQGGRHPYEYVSTHDFTWRPDMTNTISFIQDRGITYSNFYPNHNKSLPIVGNDVWIGGDVLLSAGIKVGNGAVIASGSVVTKDVQPYSIVGGNPAKLIKMRFSEELINLFLQSSWWDYAFTDFLDLPLNDPCSFINKFIEIKSTLSPFSPTRVRLSEMPD